MRPRPRRSSFLFVLMFVGIALAGCVIRLDEERGPAEPRTDLAEEAAAPGWPAIQDALIRPGTKIFGPETEQDGQQVRQQCTAGFVFSDPDNTTLYVATGSHCFGGVRIGSTVLLAAGRATGTLVYCSWGTQDGSDVCPHVDGTRQVPRANDLALVEIDPAYRSLVHPSVYELGGPTGLGTQITRGDPVFMYGNSQLRDQGFEEDPERADVRVGRAWDVTPQTVVFTLQNATNQGDSGSPLIDDEGRAQGIVQFQGQLERCADDGPDIVGATRLAPALAFMEANADLEVVLATWPLADVPAAAPMPEQICQ